jgi:pantoate--beta-alanine ligase
MKVFFIKKELQDYLQRVVDDKLSIGFVPTMGALHQGHIALVEKAKQENELVVCSIFVNPTQFNNANDLKKYPRTIENDLFLLEKAKCDVVFVPEVKDMYTNNEKLLEINLDALASIMEGEFRPGHFDGVVTVVNKFFDIIQPNNAYFGEKDFQQYLVVKKMVEVLNKKVNIIPCPTSREKNGLAMSSRNKRLSKEAFQRAGIIFECLCEVKSNFHNKSVDEIQAFVKQKINAMNGFELEYFELIDIDKFEKINNHHLANLKNIYAFIAVHVEDVRLIDNICIMIKQK